MANNTNNNVDKKQYRDFFKQVSPFIRFQTVINENDIGILQPNFSRFLNGNDSAVTDEKLRKLKNACEDLGGKMCRKV